MEQRNREPLIPEVREVKHSGGFYDRLLGAPEFRAFRCGLCFAAQEVPRVPTEPWDVRLPTVVTEQEVWAAQAPQTRGAGG